MATVQAGRTAFGSVARKTLVALGVVGAFVLGAGTGLAHADEPRSTVDVQSSFTIGVPGEPSFATLSVGRVRVSSSSL